MSSRGRTELKICLSRAKNVNEAAGDVRFCVCPQKTSKNVKKRIFSYKISEIFRTCPNASGRIRMHPNASECIRAHPSRSQQVRASPKTSKNWRKRRKTCEKLAKFSRKFSRSLVLKFPLSPKHCNGSIRELHLQASSFRECSGPYICSNLHREIAHCQG